MPCQGPDLFHWPLRMYTNMVPEPSGESMTFIVRLTMESSGWCRLSVQPMIGASKGAMDASRVR